MRTDDEDAPGRITPEQYREIKALCEYWFDRIAGDFDEPDPREEEERKRRETLRARCEAALRRERASEERLDADVLRIEFWEQYRSRLRADLRTVQPLLDCLDSKMMGLPPDHCMWDPLLKALEEWKEPLYDNLPLPNPLKPPPWAPGTPRST